MGTVAYDWSVSVVARQTAGTKLHRRHPLVTSVRPVNADWLRTQAAPVLNYLQKRQYTQAENKRSTIEVPR